MASALVIPNPAGLLIPKRRAAVDQSAAHQMASAFVWVTVALGAIVFVEPAPVDAFTFGLFMLLPVIGLTAPNRALAGGFALWLIIAGFGVLSTALSRDASGSALHTAVTLYLSGSCFLFASYVAKKPQEHTRLILSAYLAASVAAATLGVIGYLDLFPGAFELLTRYSRATATFKDPNVFGPFLICGLLTALHLWLVRTPLRGLAAIAGAAVITLGILFSFSRGAWAATIFALGVYIYLYMLTAERNFQRLKLAGAVLLGAALLGLFLAAALQSDSVARLLEDRTALAQTYDQGTEGRFGGQQKAVGLIIENPFGIGAAIFGGFHHHEEVHNVYLSMMLNAGWIGGLIYFVICAGTLALGFQHALRRTKTQPLFLIVYAALAANIVEGVLIDTDHWRHFYLLMGIVWGLMAGDRRIMRRAKAMRDVRPILRHRVLILPPSRRQTRIGGRVVATIPTALPFYGLAPRRKRSRRPRRIVRPLQ